MPRKKLIAANWKMNKSIPESVSFIDNFKNSIKSTKIKDFRDTENPKDFPVSSKNEIVICPPFASLNEVKKSIKGTKIKLGAQNMHFEEKGAFTGEISAPMLRDAGCEYVILGHSERRAYFDETDGIINKKIKAALKNKLKAILCIGETLEQRESNETKAVIKFQLENCLRSINNEEIKNIVIAYEPVWAIGTGKNATPEQAEEVHLFIRGLLKKLYNVDISENIRIIYGGSVNEKNAKELLAMKNIDGALVGGASLDPKSFAEICNT
ncbi:triose-phosphate isomerase [Candidatus Woesearchaeota archaeon]|nr:triose-phosphate isomerase [Candidatus Woesearchaeota archaeon]